MTGGWEENQAPDEVILALERLRHEALVYRDRLEEREAEVADYERRLSAADRQVEGLRSEVSRLRRRLRRLRARYDELKNRRTVRATRVVAAGGSRLRQLLGTRARRARGGSDPQADEEPHPAAPTSFSEVRARARVGVPQHEPAPFLGSAGRGSRGSLYVAVIAEERTVRSLAFECQVVDVGSTAWRDVMAERAPDLLFVESGGRESASGPSGTSGLVHEIVTWCREQRVPTVFWNTEDPDRIDRSLDEAAWFDHVFTTDLDSVARYALMLGHDRVGLLPNACQPRLQNPIETEVRSQGLAYLNGYSRRHPERMHDLAEAVQGASDVMSVTILDPRWGTTDAEHAFPEEYAAQIAPPGSSAARVGVKGFRFALTLTGGKRSQTQFDSGAIDLIATNTVAVSNYARGLRLMFGDLVAMSDSREGIRDALSTLVEDGDRTDRQRAMALRKVLQEHTWSERLEHVVAAVSGTLREPVVRVVTTVSVVHDVQQCERVLQITRAQIGVEARPCFLTTDVATREWLEERGLPVHDPVTAEGMQLSGLMDADALGVALVHHGDWHGPHHLLDLVLAWAYCDAGIVGKAISPAGTAAVEYQSVPTMSLRGGVLSRAAASVLRVSVLLADEQCGAPLGIDAFAIHRFDFVLDGCHLEPEATREAEASLSIDVGMSLAEIYRRLDAVQLEVAHDCPMIDASWFEDPVSVHLDVTTLGSGLRVDSKNVDDARQLIWSARPLDPRRLWPDGVARFGVITDGELRVEVVLRFLSAEGGVLASIVRGPEANHHAAVPSGSERVVVGLAIRGSGVGLVRGVVLDAWTFEPAVALHRGKVLLVADNYPSYSHIYRYGFVHARVRHYREAGLDVDVFRLRMDDPPRHHEYEGVEVTTGSAAVLRKILATRGHDTLLVHFMTPELWDVLSNLQHSLHIVVWVHGAEVQPWHRRSFNHTSPAQLAAARAISEVRTTLWRSIIDAQGADSRLHFVFVSRHFAEQVMADLDRKLAPEQYSVVPNPIDTDTFRYVAKEVGQRHRVLSVRSYASRIYANDLAVAAVLELAEERWFGELSFRFVGDGELFEETLAPLRGLSNVVIERGFLSRDQLAAAYRESGVLLIPTRSDTHGVSRDEAMAAGLVPVTNGVAAVPEFLGPEEGFLAPPEDAHGLAEGIRQLHHDPGRFLRMSERAAARVRAQAGAERVIPQELALIRARDGRHSDAN